MLTLAPGLEGSGRRRNGRKELRTLFFDLTHEDYQGHTYHLVLGTARYQLQQGGSVPKRLLRRRFWR